MTKKKIRDLSDDEVSWMLSLVSKTDSDLDDSDEVMGWVNYYFETDAEGRDILKVTYENAEEDGEERDYQTARFLVTPLDSKLEHQE